MHNTDPFGLRKFRQRSCKRIPIFCWILGLTAGMLVAAGAGDSFSLMMRGADFSAVSIPGLLITFLPFLLTAFAVYSSQPWILTLLILCKSFSFGYCTFGIMAVYNSASWLVRWLLMFSDCCSAAFLMWLWLRQCDSPGKCFLKEIAACTAAGLLVAILDICAISPFAAMLL